MTRRACFVAVWCWCSAAVTLEHSEPCALAVILDGQQQDIRFGATDPDEVLAHIARTWSSTVLGSSIEALFRALQDERDVCRTLLELAAAALASGDEIEIGTSGEPTVSALAPNCADAKPPAEGVTFGAKATTVTASSSVLEAARHWGLNGSAAEAIAAKCDSQADREFARLLLTHHPQRDEGEMADMVRHIGLTYDERPIYGNETKYMLPRSSRSGRSGLWQIPNQIGCALATLAQQPVHSFLEIGTFAGYTGLLLASLLRGWLPHEQRSSFWSLSIDIHDYRNPCTKELSTHLQHPLLLRHAGPAGPSLVHTELAGRMVDVCFIDGCHKFECVSADYNEMKQSCRVVMFHDIKNKNTLGVVRFWQELRAQHVDTPASTLTHLGHGAPGARIVECVQQPVGPGYELLSVAQPGPNGTTMQVEVGRQGIGIVRAFMDSG